MFARNLRKLIPLITMLAASVAATAGSPTGTAFSYQGRVNRAGSPVSGTADFRFSLWDAAQGGSQIGSAVSVSNLNVKDGLFTAAVDFGASAFGSDARFIEIDFRSPAGSGQYVKLSPRQELTPVPFANAVRGLSVDNAGNAGIGTQSPIARLQISPTEPGLGLLYGQGTSSSAHTQLALGVSELSGGSAQIQGIKYSGYEWGNLSLNPFGGNVSVGTTTPDRPLTIRGFGQNGEWISFRTADDASTAWHINNSNGGLDFVQSGIADYRLFLSSNGSVGLGVGDPKARLQFGPSGLLSDDLSSVVVGANYYESGGYYNLLDWNKPATWIRMYPQTTTDRFIRFEYYDKGGPYEMASFGRQKAVILAEKVGINDSTPEYTLDVNGNGSILDLIVKNSLTTGTLKITGGGDLAEPFDVNSDVCATSSSTAPASAEVEPGMVVCIDVDHAGALRIATNSYDSTVAGVISGAGGVNPGLTLQQPGTLADGKHLVALNGRVYTYVDADAGGPIRPGDLLTTSETPGHAMKAADRDRSSGAIVGKAMTELKSGKGLVLVLVNLQ